MQDKIEAMKRLKKALKEGKVDEDIIDLLEEINSIEGMHTTSSCSGRIGVMETPEIGAKPHARWLLKKHREISLEELLDSLKGAKNGLILFKVQSPILHVVCKDLSLARKLHHHALQAGFKYTNFKTIDDLGRTLVEINSTESLSVPLGKDGKLYIDEGYFPFLVNCANFVLRRAKAKLERLRREIEKLKEELSYNN